MPILGIGYLITIEGPTNIAWAKDIFQIVRCVLLSTQGLVISLPYCYLNSEVQEALMVRWRRWRLVRRVEAEYMMKTVKIDKIEKDVCLRSDV